MKNNSETIFTTVFLASSCARLEPNHVITLKAFPSTNGKLDLKLITKYKNEGFTSPVPRELCIEAIGPASSIDEAIQISGTIVRSLISVLAISANAYIDIPNINLAYDTTPKKRERKFYEKYIEDEVGVPSIGRGINPLVTINLLQAIHRHPEIKRLLRAIIQYSFALQNWIPGAEIPALAHLYMGIDALTKAVLREHCKKYKIDETKLLDSWSITKKKLDSEVRLRLLFQNDADCYIKAKDASDGFEHGYKSFADIHTIAKETLEKTAFYLRSGILNLLDISNEDLKTLLDPPYNTPCPWLITRSIGGTIISETDNLSADGQEYPFIKWDYKIADIKRKEDGNYNIEIEQKFTTILGEGVEFKHETISVAAYTPLTSINLIDLKD